MFIDEQYIVIELVMGDHYIHVLFTTISPVYIFLFSHNCLKGKGKGTVL